MSKHQRIAILMGQEIGYCRDILRGIQSYTITKPGWIFHDSVPDMRIIKALKEWNPHGIIGHIDDEELANALGELGKPMVNTAKVLPDRQLPHVGVNDRMAGGMAADYFIDKGFRHFGYYGSEWAVYSKEREEGFERRLKEEGFEVDSCYAYLKSWLPMEGEEWKVRYSRILEWLTSLPKPVAILASNDRPAKRLMRACRELGIDVPTQIAVLGIDNDEIECNLTTPPLSSIALPAQRVGYEAAKMLDRMMNHQRIKHSHVEIPPTGIVSRRSTDIVAVEDPQLAKAMQFIQHHAIEEITVDDVAKAACVSRRTLERSFKATFKRSVLNEIRRTRVMHARKLLVQTNFPMPFIAEKTGFSNAARFCHVFRQFTGEPPTAFRQRGRDL